MISNAGSVETRREKQLKELNHRWKAINTDEKKHSIVFTVRVNASIYASPSESVFIRVHPWLNCRFYVDRSRNKMISIAESAET